MCIGCGVCAIASRGAVSIKLDRNRGLYQADISSASGAELQAASRVCPFSDDAPNETELGTPTPSPDLISDQLIGLHVATFAGRVTNDDYVLSSSSGGLASWFITDILRRGDADAVISVGRDDSQLGELFRYEIQYRSHDARFRKSHYYAATLTEVIREACETELRFIVVGVPCFIKAVRALAREMPAVQERLAILVSLVCGHMKTQHFGESMAWQLGVPPHQLAEVNFRLKARGRLSSDYDFGARAIGESRWRRRPTRRLLGGNWGHNAFQPEACNFCDDVVGETSDISFGDAWLPEFLEDSRGTNVVIVRNSSFLAAFDQGVERGEIVLQDLSAERVAASQAGGFRHRREGLAIRLADDVAQGLSVPAKRVEPNPDAVSPGRAALIRKRRELARESQKAFRRARVEGKFSLYARPMRRLIREYERMSTTPLTRISRTLVRVGGDIFGAVPGPLRTQARRLLRGASRWLPR